MSVDIDIIDETDFNDLSIPGKPVVRVLVTFQRVDGTVDSIQLPREGYTKDKRNKAIAEKIRKTPPKVRERVRV